MNEKLVVMKAFLIRRPQSTKLPTQTSVLRTDRAGHPSFILTTTAIVTNGPHMGEGARRAPTTWQPDGLQSKQALTGIPRNGQLSPLTRSSVEACFRSLEFQHPYPADRPGTDPRRPGSAAMENKLLVPLNAKCWYVDPLRPGRGRLRVRHGILPTLFPPTTQHA